ASGLRSKKRQASGAYRLSEIRKGTRLMLRLSSLVAVSIAVSAMQSAAPTGPQFDVVSIKPNVSGAATGPPTFRPDGGFTTISVPIAVLIGRAYPGNVPADMVGLPDWARREYYD